MQSSSLRNWNEYCVTIITSEACVISVYTRVRKKRHRYGKREKIVYFRPPIKIQEQMNSQERITAGNFFTRACRRTQRIKKVLILGCWDKKRRLKDHLSRTSHPFPGRPACPPVFVHHFAHHQACLYGLGTRHQVGSGIRCYHHRYHRWQPYCRSKCACCGPSRKSS